MTTVHSALRSRFGLKAALDSDSSSAGDDVTSTATMAVTVSEPSVPVADLRIPVEAGRVPARLPAVGWIGVDRLHTEVAA